MNRKLPLLLSLFISTPGIMCSSDAASRNDEGSSAADAADTRNPSADMRERLDAKPSDLGNALDGLDPTDSGLRTADSGDAATDLSGRDMDTGQRCAFPLVELQTGRSTDCAGGNSHFWPIGMGPNDCHGWSAVDPSGREHDNSANAIGCNSDGSFTFTQFAGNLSCEGTGTVKTFSPDVCQQDIPPVLYTNAVNLACCEGIDHPDCITGSPSVSVPGGAVFLNGVICE
jgi:hypothetical protein